VTSNVILKFGFLDIWILVFINKGLVMLLSKDCIPFCNFVKICNIFVFINKGLVITC
jgi:hypothetical protein